MRSFLFLMLAMAFHGVTVKAQQTSPAMQKALDKVCNCVNQIKPDTVYSKGYEQQFLNCFATEATAELIAVAEEKGLDFTDQTAMKSLGIEIAKELIAQKCPGYMELIRLSAERKVNAANQVQVLSATGIVSKIETKDFVYVLLKGADGREQSFIWLDYFPGSDKYTGGKISTLVGKSIIISFVDKEVYLPKAGNYYKLKQITAIQ